MKTCNEHIYIEKNNGHQNHCLECYRKYQRDYAKVLRKRLCDMIDDYKVKNGCVKCGYNENAAALEFDHIVPIKRDKKKRYGARNKKEFFNIINDPNVQVLCANCHRIKTRENGDYMAREAI